MLGMAVAQAFRRNTKTTRTTSTIETSSVIFYVMNRRANRGSPVVHDLDVNRGRNRSLQLRQDGADPVDH